MPTIFHTVATVFLVFCYGTNGHMPTQIDCRCPRFVETYSIEGSFSIDMYAILGPVEHIDYSNQCSDVSITCTSFSSTWTADAWAVYNGTMTSLIKPTSRIWCVNDTWHAKIMGDGETQIWKDVSVYCQSYRFR